MTPAQILLAAKALVRRGWTQRAEARNADGITSYVGSPDAASWCVTGATATAGGPYVFATEKADEFIRAAIGKRSIETWNDARGRTRGEVLRAFSKALRLAEAA